jgi:hypothetical protein
MVAWPHAPKQNAMATGTCDRDLSCYGGRKVERDQNWNTVTGTTFKKTALSGLLPLPWP